MLEYKSQMILRPHDADVISDLRSLYHIPFHDIQRVLITLRYIP